MANGLFCFTAAALGLKHGLDFDHIAAIADLIGSSSVSQPATDGSTSLRVAKMESCRLAAMYALGHAAVVSLLGVGAVLFRALLPSWIDPVMEKVVGLTLIGLGAWMIYCLVQSKENEPAPTSRGALLLKSIAALRAWIYRKFLGRSHAEHSHEPSQLCDWRCAASIGAIHGIGAETGTQVLLMASVAGSGELTLSLLILCSFIFGMLVSTLALALLIGEGYYRILVKSSLLSLVSGTIAGISIVTGALFVAGRSDLVPNLYSLWKP